MANCSWNIEKKSKKSSSDGFLKVKPDCKLRIRLIDNPVKVVRIFSKDRKCAFLNTEEIGRKLKEKDKNYPFVSKELLPENPVKEKDYIVIAYGSTTEHRKMLPEVFEGLKKFFLAKEINVVLLGKSDHELVCS